MAQKYPCYRSVNDRNEENTNPDRTILCDVDDVKLKDPTGIYASRSDIDYKLKELYQLPGTSVENAKEIYSATMVAGSVWTIFAVSLVYYTYTME